ncbi:Hsp20/alpha crystallin family protein [Pontibacter sp. H249]|uniref:Hsp20/alpha crystallin family protein n=1 Tax=Pontibacter sp. H249 TaxID=3133420 RepID=UPI0030C1DCAE
MKRINKEFLHSIALYLDLFNTVGGGVAETYTDVKIGKHKAVINIWTPSISPEAYNVTLHNNVLTVSVNLPSEYDYKVKVPMYSRAFLLPPAINLSLVEATHQDGKLKVLLPYFESVGKPKEIEIRQL